MPKRVIILGAGISGLATAWYLRKYLGLQIRLMILEKSSRAGGWIQSIQKEGFLFEQGPRSCRGKGASVETLALIESLGLEDKVILPSQEARNRYIYTQKGLQRLPKQLWEVPFSPLTHGWGKAFLRDLCMPRRNQEDETIQNFFSRRLGKEWTERLIDPFVSGIFAGDTGRLSLKSCFPALDHMEQRERSLLLAVMRTKKKKIEGSDFVQSISREPLFSFQEGLETLTETLAKKLDDCLYLNHPVQHLQAHSDGITVRLDNGQSLDADVVISTLPAYACRPLFHDTMPSLADKLDQLPYASLKVVNMGYRSMTPPIKGFGYLIPSQAGSSVLGCIEDSSVFSQQNRTSEELRLTVMLGGYRHPEVEEWDDQRVVAMALAALQEQCGLSHLPDVVHVRPVQKAIPQYEVGYELWKKEVFELAHAFSPHLMLSGTAFMGISINDCISAAQRISSQMHEHGNH